jgi:hypothetical protein
MSDATTYPSETIAVNRLVRDFNLLSDAEMRDAAARLLPAIASLVRGERPLPAGVGLWIEWERADTPRVIQAIKAVREAAACGLVLAKQAVDCRMTRPVMAGFGEDAMRYARELLEAEGWTVRIADSHTRPFSLSTAE